MEGLMLEIENRIQKKKSGKILNEKTGDPRTKGTKIPKGRKISQNIVGK